MTNFVMAYFSPGPFELAIIAGIVLLLFGNRLPSAMRNMGRSVTEFKKGVKGVDDEGENHVESKDHAQQE